MNLLYFVSYPVVFFRCVSFYRFLFFVNSINDKGVNTALRIISYSYPSLMIYFTHHSFQFRIFSTEFNFLEFYGIWATKVVHSRSVEDRADNHLNSFVKRSSTAVSVTAYDLNDRPCSALSEMKPVTTNRNLSS